MYDPLSEHTRIVNVQGTDVILQIVRKKDGTHILPLSKKELRGSPESWKLPILSGTMLFSTIFIWGWVFGLPTLPVLLAASPVFLLASIIGMKALYNCMFIEPAEEELVDKKDKDFNSERSLPEIVVEEDLLNARERTIIDTYREQVFESETFHRKTPDYITDRSFSQLFNQEEQKTQTDNEEHEEKELKKPFETDQMMEPVFVEDNTTDTTDNSFKLN